MSPFLVHYLKSFLLNKSAASSDYPFSLKPFSPGARRELSDEEWQNIEKGLSRWAPALFKNYGTPVENILANPVKNSLIYSALLGLLGAGLGAGGGYLYGNDKYILPGALLGGSSAALLSFLGNYIRRKNKNENIIELMHRLPPNAKLRDLMFLENRDDLSKARLQRALLLANNKY